MSFYVIDGPDGCGKTTLANALQSETGGMVYRWHKDSDFQQYAHALLNVMDAPLPTIWDRCFIDERVYQPVMRPGEESRLFTLSQFDVLCHLFKLAAPKFIFCHSIIREEDPYVTPEQNRQVLRGFQSILCDNMFNNIPIRYYDAREWTPAEFASYVK